MKKQLQTAIEILQQRDAVIASIIKEVGECGIRERKNYYKALVHSIMAQQISVKASQSIGRKFYDLIDHQLEPENILKFSVDDLKTAGLSRQKATYIRDLSTKFAEDKYIYNHLGRFSNQEIIQKLTEIKGIGVWTAQMFLISSLGRLDVLPVDDVGFQNAVMKFYGLRKKPSKKYLEKLGKIWSPYASVAVWYLWEAMDNTIM